MREKLPIIVLRIIAILSAIVGVLACIFMLPPFAAAMAKDFPAYAAWQYPILFGLYAAAGCFFFALYHFWLLCGGIDGDGALSTKRLRMIRYCAVVFSVLYFLSAMPIIYLAADADDAPGLILIGAFVNLFPIGVAAGMTVLERIANKSYQS